MSDTRSDSPRRNGPDSAKAGRGRSTPRTDAAIPIPGYNEDVLGELSEPTDDSPTIISKNAPKAVVSPIDDGIRGRKLAHFELLEQIGAGGMAAVLRARDSQLDRIVALKILPPDMALDAENVQRFHQEARSAAKLDHENIARVFFCGEDQRLHFIAFEFVEGDNLRTILDRRGRLPVGVALPYVLQVAAGLAHAAERGVVHRDIKPSNIIITPSGRAKLVDMGLARSLGPQKDAGLTHSGVTLGTFDYISPEQALEPRDADVRSDIYSLGCTFYHMLTGRAPVPEGTAAKKLHHHQHIPPTDPRELVPGLPDEVVLILDRMMAKDPRFRYQNAGELVQHLLTAAKHLQVGAEVPEGVLFVEAPLPRTATRKPYLLVGLAVAVVVALLWSLDQPAANPRPAVVRQDNALIQGDDKKNERKDERRVPTPPRDPKTGRSDPVPVAFQQERLYDEDDVTAEKLLAWLHARKNEGARNLRIKLAKEITLEVRDKSFTGLVVDADRVTIEAKSHSARPIIRLVNFGASPTAGCAALTVRANQATITGIRFFVDGRESGSDAPLVGLQLSGGDQHKVSECDFIQCNPAKENQLNSLVVAAEGKVPRVDLSTSLFVGYKKFTTSDPVIVGGQNAVFVKGPSAINAVNCLFGPHTTTFGLEGKNEALSLENCSIMLGNDSTAFNLLPNALVRLTTLACLIGSSESPPLEGGGATLIRLGRGSDLPAYSGDNGYFNIQTFLLPPDGEGKISLAELNSYFGVNSSDTSKVFSSAPWEEEKPLTNYDEAARAFLPYLDLEELRRSGDHLLGAEIVEGKLLTEGLPKAVKRALPKDSHTRYVQPRKDDSKWGIYSTLEAAVAASNSGDTIFLRYNGELAEQKLEFKKSELELLTIKRGEGYRPVLTFGATTGEKESSFIRLLSGKIQLHFEGVEILLRPRAEFLTQSLLAFFGDAQVTFKDCVITLDQGNFPATSLAVASFPDPRNSMMKMEPTTPRVEGQKPHLTFTNCFVRGTGDLVRNQSGRAFDLDANRSLIALSGSLCSVDVTAITGPSGLASVLRLDRTTTFLGEQLLRVQGKEVKDLNKVPVHQVVASECLFLPARSGQPLVRFETQDSDADGLEDKLKGIVQWETGKANAYGTFDPLLSHWQLGETEKRLDLGDWKSFTGANLSQSKFREPAADASAQKTPFSSLIPAQLPALRAGEQLIFGAEVPALPKPLPVPKPR